MKTHKFPRVLALLLVIALCFSLLPNISALATGGTASFSYSGEFSAQANAKFTPVNMNDWPYSVGSENSTISPEYSSVGELCGILTSLADGFTLFGWSVKVGDNAPVVYEETYLADDYSIVVWIGSSDIPTTTLALPAGGLGGVYVYDVSEPNVVVEPIIVSTTADFTLEVVSSDATRGAVDKEGKGENSYQLTATPSNNYMLDYWTKNNDDTPVHVGEVSFTEVIEENTTYTAHFKIAQLILPDVDARIIVDTNQAAHNVIEYGNPRPDASVVREGNNVIINIAFTAPSNIFTNTTGAAVQIDLFTGESTASENRFGGGLWYRESLAKGTNYINIYVNNVPLMEGFTAKLTLNNGTPTIRYYDLTGYIQSDALLTTRDGALNGLASVYAFAQTSAKWSQNSAAITGIYNTAVTAIENADDEQTINSANNNALAEIIALISGGTSNSAINVTVAVEKFTIDGAYIVVPTQVTLPTGATAGQALEVALALAFPDAEIPLFHNGSSGPGYAGGIYDPSYAGNPDFTGSYYADYLSEKNEGAGSGWQYAVNNDFPNISAWAQTLESGDVVRWQYTLSLGNDLKNLANKDALTWKIAELRAAGKSYSGALTAATKLNASQSEVNAAFLALYGIAPPVQTSAGYGGAVTPAEGGAYTVAATSEGYVIDEIWVDGVKLTDVQGLSEVTVTPSSSVFATFAYTINFPNPANGTLSVSRGATSLKSGDIVSAGEILTITSSVTLKLSGLTLVEGDDYRVVAPQNAPPTIEVSNLTIDENGDCTITAENNSALLPKSLLSEIGEGKTLTVDAELGKLTFNYAALAALAALNGDEVSVTIEAAAPLDSRPVFSLKINGGDVSSFGAGGSVSVKLPYTQVGDEILANKKVYNVVGTALSRIAGSGYYDGFVTFDTSHFSDYLIGDVVKGDTNGNALVDANDAMLVGRAAAGLDTLTEEVTGICDMNGNGVIDANDAMLIGRLAAHLD